MRLIPFTEDDGKKIHINPDHVRVVREWSSEATAQIIFADDRYLIVKMAVAATVDALAHG
jgi:hypothetical protein